MRFLFIILGIVSLSTKAFSQAVCEGSKTELGRILLDQNRSLLACGSQNDKNINDLSIQYINKDKAVSIFTSDDAFKTYRLEKKGNEFQLSEGLNFISGFSPLIELKVSCVKEKCAVQDIRCLFTRNSDLAKNKEILPILKQKKCEKIGSKVDEIFAAAIKGNESAIHFFSDKSVDVGCSAEGSELYMTYREDIKRMKKLGCFK